MERTTTPTFRAATHDDLPAIREIVQAAILRLGRAGVDQWQSGYPNRALIEADVAQGVGYLLEWQGVVVAYGAVLFTEEEEYRTIEGEWLTAQEKYVVLHRLCVREEMLGQGFASAFMQQVEVLARDRVQSFRIDTHPDNLLMQRLLARRGFAPCGVVRIEQRPFLAFEKLLV